MGTVEKEITPKAGKTRYKVRYSFTDATGKRVHRTRRFDRKKDADAWLSQQEADLSRGVYFEPSRELFGSYLDRWSNGLRVPIVSASTIYTYRSAVRLRFDAIRTTPLCDLTAAQLGRLIDGWRVEKLSEATIRQAKMILGIVLDEAVADRKIVVSPLDLVKRPIGNTGRDEIWGPAQVRAFLDATTGDDTHYLWMLMFLTLARIGEIAGLRWSDVDFTANELHIRRTWTRNEQGMSVLGEGTKTEKSRRTIPLVDELVSELRGVRMSRPAGDEWVAVIDGRPAKPALIRERWNEAVTAHDMPPLTPHGTRRSGATAMIAAGVSPGVVQKLLGHTDPAFTMRMYIKLREEDAAPGLVALHAVYADQKTGVGVQSASKLVDMDAFSRKRRGKSE